MSIFTAEHAPRHARDKQRAQRNHACPKRFLGAILAIALINIFAGFPRQQVFAAPNKNRTSGAFIATVCLDPGHPSENNIGQIAQNGVTETAVNWKIALRVKDLLKKERVAVVLTKKRDDEFVTNKRRAEIANAAKADLFIRLHCDTGEGSGITFYYPDRSGRRRGMRGPALSIRKRSQAAARIIHDAAVAKLGPSLKDNGVLGESLTALGRKRGALTGSIYSQAPVMLVEMVYLSNKADARFIKSGRGQKQMAEALVAGIMAYLKTNGRGPAAGNDNAR